MQLVLQTASFQLVQKVGNTETPTFKLSAKNAMCTCMCT